MEIRTRTIERLRDALLKSGQRSSAITSSADRTLARENLLSTEEQAAISRVDGVAETMFLVIAADEQVTDTEMAALRGAIRGLTGDVLSDELVQVLVEKYALRLRDNGREGRLRALAQTLSDKAEAQNAFALAAAVALADSQLAESESFVISELKNAFGLSDDEVSAILGELAADAQDD